MTSLLALIITFSAVGFICSVEAFRSRNNYGHGHHGHGHGHGFSPRHSGNARELAYNSTCLNPINESGHCVLVKECPPILATLRKETLNNDDIRFLYESECGKLQRKSLVCCVDSSIVYESQAASESTDGVGVRVDQPGSANADKWNLLPKAGECGIQPSYQLFGENVTKLDEQPWTALVHYGNMQYETTFECGGALISSQYVLTAAHCVTDRNKWKNLTVRLGEWDTEATVDCISIEDYSEFYCADPAVDIPVEKVILHEQYARQHRPQLNDLALLRLVRPVETTSWIRPVCLPEQGSAESSTAGSKATDQIYTLAGWGNNGCGFNSRYKIRSKLSRMDTEHCKRYLPQGFQRSSEYLCTVPVNKGEKCHADSGGAVTALSQVDGVGIVHRVAGILNHMKECQSGQPVGIFTDVRPYVDWIVGKLEE